MEEHKDADGFVKIDPEIKIKEDNLDNNLENSQKQKAIQDIKNFYFNNQIPADFGKTIEELEKLDSKEISCFC